MSFPTEQEKSVVIPAVLRKGVWHPLYGGPMPKLKEGTFAEITLPEHGFEDPAELQRFNLEDTITILAEGSPLWAVMSPNYGMGGPALGIPKWAKFRPQDGLENLNLVEFQISEDLSLHLRGTKHAQLEPCQCKLEGFPPDISVLSINQAYTRLSEKFEPRRKSHAGNVFTRVFYLDGTLLLPLEELRTREVSKLEKRLYHQSGELPLSHLT
jgi:hypothetical protein